MAGKKQTFEMRLERLEAIVAALEQGQAPLEESLKLFEEGTKLASACAAELDSAQQQVVRLMKGPDGQPQELPFDGAEAAE